MASVALQWSSRPQEDQTGGHTTRYQVGCATDRNETLAFNGSEMETHHMGSQLDMKLGLVLPEGERDMGGKTARWSDYVTMAQTAEDMGFDSLWFVDHLLYLEGATVEPPQGVRECWSVLAGLAAVTSRVELAPLVSCTGYQKPSAACEDRRHHRRDLWWPADSGSRCWLARTGVSGIWLSVRPSILPLRRGVEDHSRAAA